MVKRFIILDRPSFADSGHSSLDGGRPEVDVGDVVGLVHTGRVVNEKCRKM